MHMLIMRSRVTASPQLLPVVDKSVFILNCLPYRAFSWQEQNMTDASLQGNVWIRIDQNFIVVNRLKTDNDVRLPREKTSKTIFTNVQPVIFVMSTGKDWYL